MTKFLEVFVLTHGAFAMFLLGIVEELAFFIPSTFVFLGAGFLLVPPDASFAAAFAITFVKIGLTSALGVTLGSLIVYPIVYIGGKPAVERWGKYIGLSWKSIAEAERRWTAGRMDEVALFFFRAIPIFPISVVSAVCGLIRLPWQEFLIYTFLGTVVRATGSSLVGWYVGKAYKHYAEQLATGEHYGLALLIVLIFVGYALIHWHRSSE